MIRTTEYKSPSGSDGLALALLRIEPEASEIRGIVQLVHGMSEHKERYVPFMRFLAKHGYLCVIHDNRGHGGSVRSAEDLGYLYEGGYKAFIEDILDICIETKEYVSQRCPGRKIPYILLGHSMGSLAVRCFIRRYDAEIDALCVMGCPSLMKGMRAGLALVSILAAVKGDHSHSALADKILLSSLSKRYEKEGLENAWISSDRKEVEKYNADPLCGFTFTLNGYRNLVKLVLLCYRKHGFALNRPSLPIRFFSGAEDPCGISRKDIARAAGLLKHAGYKDVRVRLYPGMRHEILKEKKRAWVYKDILAFLEEIREKADSGDK